MDITGERSVSGRALVITGLVVVAIVTAVGAVFGPGLRQQVLQEDRPRTLREPVAAGEHNGQVWEVVGRYDGAANCAQLRFDGEDLDRACDTGAPAVTATTLPDGGPTIAYGIAAEDASEHTVVLNDGEEISAPVVAGDLGFPVGFWAVELPDGAGLADEGS